MRKKSFNLEDILLWGGAGIGVFCMFAVLIYAIIKQETRQADCLIQHAIERPVVTETIKPTTKNNVLYMESCQCVIKEEHTVCTCPNTNAVTKTAAAEEKQNNGPETTGEKVVFWGSMGALALAPLLLD